MRAPLSAGEDLAYWNTQGQAVGRQHVARRAAPGLVPVPTTCTRQRLPLDYQGKAQAVAGMLDRLEAADGFLLDPQGLRLAKLRMHVGFAARAHAVSEKRAHREHAVMVTLTYRGDNSAWRADQLTQAIRRFRAWCSRRCIACRYVWVAELQERGVIHYHLLAWMPRSVTMPKWDKQGWWPHGMTKTERARNAVPYLLKYLSKDASKSFGSFPRGARLYGVGGLDASLRRARSWLNRPSFVQGNSSVNDGWRRAKGGGWMDLHGFVWPSEYRMVRVGDQRGVVRVHEHPRSIEASGPFSWNPHTQASAIAAPSVMVH